jgi:hypothetical protein
MSERTLKQLVGALVVAVGVWAVTALLSRGGGSVGGSGDLAAFFEGVVPASVAGVRISGPGSDGIELTRSRGGWLVNGFEADSSTVDRFLGALAATEVGDLVASNPANHARMGVTADSALRLEVRTAGGERALLVGDAGTRFNTAFARLPDEDGVHLLMGDVRSQLLRREPDWRRKTMGAVDTAQVQRLEILGDGGAYAFVRGDSLWSLGDGTPADPGVVQDLLSELSGLQATGFVADGDSLAAVAPDSGIRALDASGAVLLAVTLGGTGTRRWGLVEGDSVRYEVTGFRADRLVPSKTRAAAPSLPPTP